ncbi:thermonuclease family protein [Mesorhizobium sp. ANAO-SY3R2]|uniref:thermonuclease family protein n=1 Tax=Mesorhizobium sp. ANAO-SY3R2 TaxID=3166644 RepID=UPI003670FB87
MRRSALVNLGAVAAIGAVALVVMAAGPVHAPSQQVFDAARPDASPAISAVSHATSATLPASAATPARIVAPEVVAPPDVTAQTLERVEARPPLGDLGQAPPPNYAAKGHWPGRLLYRPVVTSSASFEAMGYTILIAGTEAVGPRDYCRFRDVEWNCGERAMLAFRYWLRWRAPSCRLSSPAGPQPVAAACRLGKQDIGAWLVSNGWALARPGEGYEKAEEVARKAGMGIFGPPD